MTFVIETRSAHETKSWGRRLASVLEGGELLGLMGDLGAGKTCFVKGLATGLNLREGDILSPTFTMIQEHRGRVPLYHIDLYRLEEAGLDDLGLREYLFTPGVAAVEWFERLREADELEVLSVRISYVGPSARRIEFVAGSDRYAQLLERLRSRFA
ncbi:MAG TPA: tRNA (adenosine(37)-N6)-threonylcarbamoyltransferase complex ATPase subunit type 1 TsaE [Candidatus Binataceae bacterium]|nr:tRNA (adenosine(37)-N6)-threonylcarbamoyltransferase complex ATPase subunit type 1 TsaE [Candidatus Binataceae bacterium]